MSSTPPATSRSRSGDSLLHETGEALYGPRWQCELARSLGVSERTMRRWAAGAGMPEGVYADLLQLTQERAHRLDALAERLGSESMGDLR